MGHKPTRKRKRFLLYIACCLMGGVLVCSCTTGMSFPGNPPPPAAMAQHLSQGEFMLLMGDYDAARKECCLLLEQFSGQVDDQALYLLGLVWVHPENPRQDIHRAEICFRRIAEQHSASPLVVASETWLAWIARQDQNDQFVEHMKTTTLSLEQRLQAEKDKRIQLEERLQQMKAIDLNLE